MSDLRRPIPSGFAPERVPVPAASCHGCGFEPLDLEPNCPTCGAQRMAPNVVMASRAAEQDALIARVEKTFVARSQASAQALLAFGEAVRQSVAVVNVSVRYAIDFIESDTLLFASYAKLVEAGARRPAPEADDARRRSVEAILFGSYGEDVRYAALNLGGAGLVSYGAITMVLRETAIARRASVLEENSFEFEQRHRPRPGAIPAGYRSSWATRHQLAMAKCASRIDETTADGQFPSVLFVPGRKRKTDEFMEVYIFGPFGRGAVERLILPARPSPEARSSELRMLKSKARWRGIVVEEA